MTRVFVSVFLAVALPFLSSCAGPPTLNRAVIEYDRNILQAEEELLLLNIVRVRDDFAVHFTGTQSVSATFEYLTSVGFMTQLKAAGASNTMYTLSLGANVNEKPLMTFVPLQGEEFSKKLMEPLGPKFNQLTVRPLPFHMPLRLFAAGFEVANDQGQIKPDDFYNNNPGVKSYDKFRQLVRHITYLSYGKGLRTEKLEYEEELDVATNEATYEQPKLDAIVAAEKENMRWFKTETKNSDGSKSTKYVLRKPKGQSVRGPLMILNYDPNGPNKLTSEMKNNILKEVKEAPNNFIFVSLIANESNAWPITGYFRLRNLYDVLEFLGKKSRYERPVKPNCDAIKKIKSGTSERILDPEDEETMFKIVDPAKTLTIYDDNSENPPDAIFSVKHRDKTYWISGGTDQKATEGKTCEEAKIAKEAMGKSKEVEKDTLATEGSYPSWDRQVMALLYQLYHLSMPDISKVQTPQVTIGR